MWRILGELGEAQKRTEEARRQSDQERKKLAAEAAAERRHSKSLINELVAEGKRLQKSINYVSGRFDNAWGQFVENLVDSDLTRVLNERGIEVLRTQPRLKFVDPRDHQREGEFDLVAYNGIQIVVTETKNTLRAEGVRHFIKNVKDFKVFYPHHKDKTIYAAVAGLNIEPEALALAKKEGLFVIKAPGKDSKITKIQNAKNFKPKEF